MKNIIAAAALSLTTLTTACAITSPTGRDTTTVSTMMPHLPSLHVARAEGVWFPALASEQRLPSADRLRVELRGEGFERLSATVHVCIKPDGSTYDIALAASSGSPAFDAAAVRDLGAWHYDAFSAPASARVCAPLELAYLP